MSVEVIKNKKSKAVQFDGNNVVEIAEFVGSDLFISKKCGDCKEDCKEGEEKRAKGDAFEIRYFIQGRPFDVIKGHWVVKDDKGISSIPEEDFKEYYEIK